MLWILLHHRVVHTEVGVVILMRHLLLQLLMIDSLIESWATVLRLEHLLGRWCRPLILCTDQVHHVVSIDSLLVCLILLRSWDDELTTHVSFVWKTPFLPLDLSLWQEIGAIFIDKFVLSRLHRGLSRLGSLLPVVDGIWALIVMITHKLVAS